MSGRSLLHRFREKTISTDRLCCRIDLGPLRFFVMRRAKHWNKLAVWLHRVHEPRCASVSVSQRRWAKRHRGWPRWPLCTKIHRRRFRLDFGCAPCAAIGDSAFCVTSSCDLDGVLFQQQCARSVVTVATKRSVRRGAVRWRRCASAVCGEVVSVCSVRRVHICRRLTFGGARQLRGKLRPAYGARIGASGRVRGVNKSWRGSSGQGCRKMRIT